MFEWVRSHVWLSYKVFVGWWYGEGSTGRCVGVVSRRYRDRIVRGGLNQGGGVGGFRGLRGVCN